MFVLRKEHQEALAAGYRETFEDRMVEHLQEKFPERCDVLGEDGVRGMVALGVERAAVYEIKDQADVARYIRFMFSLSPDFDIARRTAWAREILDDVKTPAAKRLDKIREVARSKRRAGE